MDGALVEYESPEGDVWVLSSPERGPGRRIFLKPDGVGGLSGVADRTAVESVTRYGARPQGWKLAPLGITLDYTLYAGKGELESLARSWRRAWATEEPGDYGYPHEVKRGRLRVASSAGGSFWTPVSSPVFPDWPNSLRGKTTLEEEMSCKGYLGHWFGEPSFHEGTVKFRVKGDRPLSPQLRLRWDGSATAVTFPSGFRLTLGATRQERIINLDRGMSGQVTRPDGTVDTLAWSGLQGLVHGMSLRPGDESSWVLGAGLTLEVTPRYLTPWR